MPNMLVLDQCFDDEILNLSASFSIKIATDAPRSDTITAIIAHDEKMSIMIGVTMTS